MQIHDVHPGRGGLIVLSDRRGDQLPLDSDVPFLAEVVEQQGDHALLAIAGRLLRCETALPLEEGARVWLFVKEASAGRIALALVDSPGGEAALAPEPGAPGAVLPPATPAGTAPSALPSGTAAAAAAAGGEVASGAAGTPAAAGSEALARSVLFLVANGRPVTAEAVQSVLPFFTGEANLARSLADLQALLSEVPEARPAALPSGLAEALPPGLLDQLRTALEETWFRPAAPGEAAPLEGQAEALARVVRRLGLDHELRLADLADLAAPAAETGEAAATPPATPPWPVALAEEDLKGLLLFLRDVLRDPEAAPKAAPAAAPPGEPPPVEAPPAAVKASPAEAPLERPVTPGPPGPSPASPQPAPAGTEAPPTPPTRLPAAPPVRPPTAPDQAPQAERLARVVDDALHNLTGQRLLAPSGGRPGQERLDLCLQVPVFAGGQPHTAELRLYREADRRPRGRAERPAALRLSCRLTTTNLGPVRLDLALRPKGTGEAHLYLSQPEVVDLFRHHEAGLREALAGAGLRLGRVTYSLAPPAPASQAAGPGGAPTGPRRAIDLRM